MTPAFNINDRVKRIAEGTYATVISREEGPDWWNYEIEYDEGGTGWWPEHSLEAA